MRIRGAMPAVAWAFAACAFHAPEAAPDARVDALLVDADPGPGGFCPALPPPSGPVVEVGTVAGLVAAIASAAPGTTILLDDGDYPLPAALVLDVAGLALRGRRGDAAAVRLTGLSSPLVFVRASGVQLASLTLAGAAATAISIEPRPGAELEGAQLYDLTIRDIGGPAVLITSRGGRFADAGTIACSRVVGPPQRCPEVLGIAAQYARGWTVRDNRFDATACTDAAALTVQFDEGSRDTLVLRNHFVGVARAVRLGDGGGNARMYPDEPQPPCGAAAREHRDGVICNNAISGVGAPPLAGADFEEGISAWHACDAWILHNTIAAPPAPESTDSITARYGDTYVHAANNLVAAAPRSLDGGAFDGALLGSNARYASLADFVDPARGDLRLAPSAVIPVGGSLAALAQLPQLAPCLADAAGVPRNLDAPIPGAFER